MTDAHSNPFVLPGFGQAGELASNPVMASMEMMRQAWQNLAGQAGLGTPNMATTLSAQELEQRITDLRVVENWLRMNLTVLSSIIQGLEVQRATVDTLKQFVNNVATATGQVPDALETLLGVKPAKGAGKTSKAAGTAPAFDAERAVAATQAWWELLRTQFDTLAAATAATMQAPAEELQPTAASSAKTTATRRKAPAGKAKATGARSARRQT